ncbi:MAG TPA: tripartite tricarboxylate transporter substrate binding protein [Burkholderiales bacterium]|nr:tripartite tricarboxylate transporter substrate binding protein [Burkholderiales bacterium]
MRAVIRAVILLLAMVALQAGAQGFPDRPIRLVVPFAPGGETDLMGRMWARHAAAQLGAVIVIDNKGGAGGAIGAAEVARAKADGYTLLAGTTTTQIINPAAMENPPYDPLKDFAAIGVLSVTPTCVVVGPAVRVSTLKEFIALIKQNPGKYSYGSAGPGTITNLTGELFKREAGGLDLQHVPYKGSGPGLQDVIAGHLPAFTPIMSATVLAQHRGGRIRILAIASDERLGAAPEIPTAAEAGLPGLRVQVFNAIFAPAGTPPEALAMLRLATARTLADAEFRVEVEKAGAEVFAAPDYDAFIHEEATRWVPIVKALGFKAQ